MALVSYSQIFKVELKICSYCILVLDLKRNGSMSKKCMYRFVSVLDLKSCSASELNEVLGKFYLELRMKNGERYKASYLAARAAISRYMAVNLSKPTCNVFRQAEFQRSNDILDGVLKQVGLKRIF